jgi:hypothetical protein
MPTRSGYQVLEGSPKGPSQSSDKFLLPYSEPARQLAVRVSDNGTVSSAILEVDPQEFDIKRYWEENGWSVVSESSVGQSEKYRCQLGPVTVIATFMPGQKTNNKTILLIRIPDLPKPE